MSNAHDLEAELTFGETDDDTDSAGTEATDSDNAGTEATAAAKPAAEKVDHGALAGELFEKLRSGIEEDSGELFDESTGVETQLGVEWMQTLIGSATNRVRKLLDQRLMTHTIGLMTALDYVVSRKFMGMKKLLDEAPAQRSTSPAKIAVELTPTERVAALILAQRILQSEGDQTEQEAIYDAAINTANDLDSAVEAYGEYRVKLAGYQSIVSELAQGENPPERPVFTTDSTVARLAAALAEEAAGTKRVRKAKSASASPSVGRPAGSVNRRVYEHIREAVTSDPSKAWTTGEICDFKSVEYGDDKPSSGAVGAWLTKDALREKAAAVVVEVDGKSAFQAAG